LVYFDSFHFLHIWLQWYVTFSNRDHWKVMS
jgi:hypothetical protein